MMHYTDLLVEMGRRSKRDHTDQIIISTDKEWSFYNTNHPRKRLNSSNSDNNNKNNHPLLSLAHQNNHILLTTLLCILIFLKGISSQPTSGVFLQGEGTISATVMSTLSYTYFSTSSSIVAISFENQPFNQAVSDFLQEDFGIDFLISSQTIPQDIAQNSTGSCCECNDIHAMPLFVSGLVLLHNIGGGLNNTDISINASPVPLILDRSTLVSIYSGSVLYWDDPAIQALNSNFQLPHTLISVLYLNCDVDNYFPSALSLFSPQWPNFTCSNDETEFFPTGTEFTSELDLLIQLTQTPDSIGYISYDTYISYLSKLSLSPNYLISLKNKGGYVVQPQISSFQSASEDFEDLIGWPSPGLQLSILDAYGENSWPISMLIYATLRTRNMDCNTGNSLYGFLQFVTTSYQAQSAISSSGYALPSDVILTSSREFLDDLSCCSEVVSPYVVNTPIGNLGKTPFDVLKAAFFDPTIYNFMDSVQTADSVIPLVIKNSSPIGLTVDLPLNSSIDLFPVRFIATGLVCIYNLNVSASPSFPSLVLDGATLAQIFTQSISSWDQVPLSQEVKNSIPPNIPISIIPFQNSDVAAVMVRAFNSFSPSNENLHNSLLSDSTATCDVLTLVHNTPFSFGCLEMPPPSVSIPDNILFIEMINQKGNIVNYTATNVLSAMEAFQEWPLEYIQDADGDYSWPLSTYLYVVFQTNYQGELPTVCQLQSEFASFIVETMTASGLISLMQSKTSWIAPSPSISNFITSDLSMLTCEGNPIYTNTDTILGAGSSFFSLLYSKFDYRSSSVNNVISVLQYNVFDSDQVLVNLTSGSSVISFASVEYADNSYTNTVEYIPIAAGGLALVYNLPGLSLPLIVNEKVLVSIFTGVITMWNDQQIAALNFGITLPSQRIQLVYREPGVSINYLLTQSLNAINSTKWPLNNVQLSPNWVVSGNEANGDDALSLYILATPYTFGYSSYAFAYVNQLSVCSFMSKENTPIPPTSETVQNAVDSFDFSNYKVFPPIINVMLSTALNSYPLTTLAYAVVKKSQPNLQEGLKTMNFIYSTAFGALPEIATPLGFASVPKSLTSEIKLRMSRVISIQTGTTVLPAVSVGCDGVVGSGFVFDACGVCNGKNTTCCKGTPAQIDQNCFNCKVNGTNKALKQYLCDDFIDCEHAEDDRHCKTSIIKVSEALSGIATVILGITIAIMADILHHRQETVFRENNVFFMSLILVGCMIGLSTVYVLSQLSRLNDFVCGVQYWFFGFAFVLTFGSMIAKTFQVYMLHRGHSSGDLSQFTNLKIIRYIGAALSVELFILLIWTIFDTPKPKWVLKDQTGYYHLLCSNDHFDIFALILGTWKGVILVVGVVLSFLTRGIDYSGNESRLIRTTIFAAALTAILIVPLLFVFSSFPLAKVLMSNGALIIVVSLILIIYFGPKLVSYHFPNSVLLTSQDKLRGKLLGPIDI